MTRHFYYPDKLQKQLFIVRIFKYATPKHFCLMKAKHNCKHIFLVLEVTAGDYGNFTDLLAKAAEEKCWRKPVHPPKSR